jgi:nucleoside-diphosphate-sugar epimerase
LSKRSFEKLLLEAIDEGLSSLGDSAKQAIYFHLEKTFNINKRDIPSKIEEFADAIEKIFGLGAKPIEVLVMQRLYEKVGGIVEYPKHKDLVFAEYIVAARQSFLRARK